MADNVLSIANIRGAGASDAGQFRASSEALGWKNKRTGQVIQFKGAEVKEANWVKGGRDSALILFVQKEDNISPTRFDGFQDKDYETVAAHFKRNFSVEISKKKMNLKGWHWGNWTVDEKTFALVNDGMPLFEVSTETVSQVLLSNKTDLTVELKNETAEDPEDVQLLELRFYVPPVEGATNVEEEETEKDENGELIEKASNVEELKAALDSVSSSTSGSSDVVAVIPDAQMLVPRGKYEIDMSLSSLRFHGRSFAFNIPYEHIQVVFVLPKPDSEHALFVIGLSQPVRQGQTQYRFLVMQMDSKIEAAIEIKLPEDKLTELGLKSTMEDSLYKIFSNLIIKLVKKPVLTPGEFKSFAGHRGIAASVKADHGLLFPLNKHLLFVHKPVQWIKLDSILTVEFLNTVGTKYFEIRVTCKNNTDYEFGSIEKQELGPLMDFLKTRVTVKADAVERTKAQDFPGLDTDDDDDSDYNSEEDEDADDDDDSDGSFASEEDDDESGGSDGEKEKKKSKKEKKAKKEKKEKKSKKEKKEKKAKKEKKSKKSSKEDGGDSDDSAKKAKKRSKNENTDEPSTKRAKTESVDVKQE